MTEGIERIREIAQTQMAQAVSPWEPGASRGHAGGKGRKHHGKCPGGPGCQGAASMIDQLMLVMDRPHGDDGACEDLAVNALDGIIFQAVAGACAALGIQPPGVYAGTVEE